jgi:hypothetical protein
VVHGRLLTSVLHQVIVMPAWLLLFRWSTTSTILQEGRCALASTFSLYIVMYGSISSYYQVITYSLKTSLSDWMRVFTDRVWTICFSFTLPLASAASTLSSTRPTASLLGLPTLLSIIGIVSLNHTVAQDIPIHLCATIVPTLGCA